MRRFRYLSLRSAILAVCVTTITTDAPIVLAQSASRGGPDRRPVPPLLQRMIGTWDVQQQMWPAAGAPAVRLQAAAANRRLIGAAFLEEVMTADGADKAADAFTRVSYVNYNHVTQQLEYVSLDSRAPQVMNARSVDENVLTALGGQDDIHLQGHSFVAPVWGDSKNVSFRYRLVLGKVDSNRQTVRLYLMPQSDPPAREFLAFEYVYIRRP